MPLKCSFKAEFPRVYMFLGYEECKFEVHFETGSRINGVSAHEQ
jgi:hypothetical protein